MMDLLVNRKILGRACASNFLEGAWACESNWLQAAYRQVAMVGVDAIIKQNAERLAAGKGEASAESTPYQMIGSVAVVGIDGPMTKHETSMSAMFGGTSTVNVRNALRKAAADPNVKSILMRVSSPGGSVNGTGDLADDVRAVRDIKPIVAYAEDMMCSAAYWVGSQASHIMASPHADVGSIGVYSQIVDDSAAHEKAGIKIHTVKSTPKKAVGIPPVTEADLKVIQQSVDETHEMFVAAISAGRGEGFDAEAVATGETWTGKKALALGLVDSVGTIDQALALAQKAAGEGDLKAAVARARGGTEKAKSATVGTPAPADIIPAPEVVEAPPTQSDTLLKGTTASQDRATPEVSIMEPTPTGASDPATPPVAAAPKKTEADERLAKLEAYVAEQERVRAAVASEALLNDQKRVLAAFPKLGAAQVAALVDAPGKADTLLASLRGARPSEGIAVKDEVVEDTTPIFDVEKALKAEEAAGVFSPNVLFDSTRKVK